MPHYRQRCVAWEDEFYGTPLGPPSHIQNLEELRGRTIAFVDPASSSGYIYPMVMLIKRGLIKDRDPKTFFKEVHFAGSHDAALLALLIRDVDATASFDTAPQQYLKAPCRAEATTQCASVLMKSVFNS